MRIHAVQCDGKISQTAYLTLDSAKKFLNGRIVGRNALVSSNGWKATYNDGKDHTILILELEVQG